MDKEDSPQTQPNQEEMEQEKHTGSTEEVEEDAFVGENDEEIDTGDDNDQNEIKEEEDEVQEEGEEEGMEHEDLPLSDKVKKVFEGATGRKIP